MHAKIITCFIFSVLAKNMLCMEKPILLEQITKKINDERREIICYYCGPSREEYNPVKLNQELNTVNFKAEVVALHQHKNLYFKELPREVFVKITGFLFDRLT